MGIKVVEIKKYIPPIVPPAPVTDVEIEYEATFADNVGAEAVDMLINMMGQHGKFLATPKLRALPLPLSLPLPLVSAPVPHTEARLLKPHKLASGVWCPHGKKFICEHMCHVEFEIRKEEPTGGNLSSPKGCELRDEYGSIILGPDRSP